MREVIQTARRRRGRGQRELAEASGVSQPNLAAIETGTRVPSLAMVSRLVAACGLQLRFELESRHADVDTEIARLREREPAGRLGSAGLAALITISGWSQPVRRWCSTARWPRASTGRRSVMASSGSGAASTSWIGCEKRRSVAIGTCCRSGRGMTMTTGSCSARGSRYGIGECTVTLDAASPGHQPMDLLGGRIEVVGVDQLAGYPDWTPRERVAVGRLIAGVDSTD